MAKLKFEVRAWTEADSGLLEEIDLRPMFRNIFESSVKTQLKRKAKTEVKP